MKARRAGPRPVPKAEKKERAGKAEKKAEAKPAAPSRGDLSFDFGVALALDELSRFDPFAGRRQQEQASQRLDTAAAKYFNSGHVGWDADDKSKSK